MISRATTSDSESDQSIYLMGSLDLDPSVGGPGLFRVGLYLMRIYGQLCYPI